MLISHLVAFQVTPKKGMAMGETGATDVAKKKEFLHIISVEMLQSCHKFDWYQVSPCPFLSLINLQGLIVALKQIQ